MEFLLLCGWAVAAAALLSLRSNSIAPVFAYFVASNAGYRLTTRRALFVAGLDGVLSTLGLWLVGQHSADVWPPLLGLTVALPVFLGMANRSRDFAMASALDAARSAQRAAESEARERALAERGRISRDIHDVLAHSLSGVSMQLELSEMLLDDGKEALARDAIGKAHSMVREGMAEARRAVSALRAETLPLDQTLRAQFWGAGEVVVTGEPRELSVEAGQTLIRAAQEALTNARRHAVGAALDVSLQYHETAVELQVSNGPAVRPTRWSGDRDGLGHGPGGHARARRSARRSGRGGADRRRPAGRRLAGHHDAPDRADNTAPDGRRPGKSGRAHPPGGPLGQEGQSVTEDEPELRLIVADDQASIREALAMMLDMTPGLRVVATAGDGEEAVA